MEQVSYSYFYTEETTIETVEISKLSISCLSKNKNPSQVNNKIKSKPMNKNKSLEYKSSSSKQKDVINNNGFKYGKYIGHHNKINKKICSITIDQENNLLEFYIPANKKRNPIQLPITNLYPKSQKELYKFIADYIKNYTNKSINNESSNWNRLVQKTNNFRVINKDKKNVKHEFILKLIIDLK